METYSKKIVAAQDYDCSIVNRRVSALIGTELKSRFEDFREVATIKTIQACQGLETCGVKKTYGLGASFDWSICPLNTMLKKG